MNQSDRVLLDGLRLVSDASDEVWELVVAEVAKAGSVIAVGGQARVEIERAVVKARTLMEKHPGHADQSVHGGKKGGGASAPSDNEPSVSIGRRAEIDAEASAMKVKRAVQATPNQREIRPAQFTAERAVMSFEDGKKAKSPQEKQKKYRESAKQAKEASRLFEDENHHDVAEALDVMSRMMNSAASNVGKAVEPVAKHPGHADQSVHGGKKGGGASASAPAEQPSAGGGGSGGAEIPAFAQARIDRVNSILEKEPAAFTSSKDVAREKDAMKRATKDDAIASAKIAHREHQKALEMEDGRKKIAYDMERRKSPKADAALADSRKYGTEAAVMFHLAAAWASVAQSLGATDADLAVNKAVEPVAKHPGHADQSVHGGARGGGKSDTQASSDLKRGKAGLQEASDRLADIKSATDAMKRSHSIGLTGDTRERVLQKHGDIDASLSRAKSNLDLAIKMHGSDRGTTQANASAAKRHVQRAEKDMAVIHSLSGGFAQGGRSHRSFENAVDQLKSQIDELVDGGVL